MGVASAVVAEVEAGLQRAHAERAEAMLRAAMAARTEADLTHAIQSVKKKRNGRINGTNERRDSGRSRPQPSDRNNRGDASVSIKVDAALLADAEKLLAALRRETAAAKYLRRTADMSGPAALARAIAVARSDPHTPHDALTHAEGLLRRRQKEQKMLRWLHVLQEARREQQEKDQRDRWASALNSGHGIDEMLPAVHALREEVIRKAANPRSSPPAWLHFCRQTLWQLPSPSLSPANLAKAKASVEVAANSTIARTAVRALMEVVRAYHPDKNRAFGDAWSEAAEEITKVGLMLVGEYKARLEQSA